MGRVALWLGDRYEPRKRRGVRRGSGLARWWYGWSYQRPGYRRLKAQRQGYSRKWDKDGRCVAFEYRSLAWWLVSKRHKRSMRSS